MTPDQWATLKYFQPTRPWGDPSKMNFDLLQRLEAWAKFIDMSYGWKVVVLCGTEGEHVANSEHPFGDAVDCYVGAKLPGKPAPNLFDVFLSAIRFGFKSVGVYPDWEVNGLKVDGLHLGVRDKPHMALWMGVKIPNSEGVPVQTYVAFNDENLRKYGVV